MQYGIFSPNELFFSVSGENVRQYQLNIAISLINFFRKNLSMGLILKHIPGYG